MELMSSRAAAPDSGQYTFTSSLKWVYMLCRNMRAFSDPCALLKPTAAILSTQAYKYFGFSCLYTINY